MSRETEKLFKELHQYIDEHSGEDRSREGVEKLINSFMAQYNGNLPQPVTEDTAETSDDYLELAFNAETMKDAQRYAKKALQLDPFNFDAEMMTIDLKAKILTDLVQGYAKALPKATKHMEEEGYFDDENIGHFWGILGTRPYMRLRGQYVQALTDCGMLGRAREECRDLLRLCEGDNMGMRYRLMHIYAYFEEEEAALALHKQFDSYDETEMLFPLSILYYKKEDYRKATQYLRRLNRANKDLRRFLKIVSDGDAESLEGLNIDGAYRPGTIEEIFVEVRDNNFLFAGIDPYFEWAYKQVKKFK